MPEVRDILSRPEDVLVTYSNQRRIISRNLGRLSSEIFVLADEAEEQAAGTPFWWRGTAMVSSPGPISVPSRTCSIGTPRIERSPNLVRSLTIGQENMSPATRSNRIRGGSRGRGVVILPAWYPRKPLQDITAVVRAIERRRARLGEREGLQTESTTLQDQTVHDPSISTPIAQLEQDISAISAHPKTGIRCCPPTIGKVPKILLNITNKNDEDSSCLTPQKKLLTDIDTVEKVVMDELRKLKRTPSAKKAEREKRVRTLMSMR